MDEKYMKIAISEAIKGYGHINNASLCGGVIVLNNKIIGQGFCTDLKTFFIENIINENKISRAEINKATLYMNAINPLEENLLYLMKQKFYRIVIGTIKPDILKNSRYVTKLCECGSIVNVGICESEALSCNEVYIYNYEKKLPYTHLKYNMTLDGKTRTYIGDFKSLNDPEADIHHQMLRNKYASIMITVDRILKFNTTLKCLLREENQPIKIIIDEGLSIQMDAEILENPSKTPIFIAVTENHDKIKAKILQTKGVNIIICKDNKGEINLMDLLNKLYSKGIDSILIEGDGSFNYYALKHKIVNKLTVFLAPIIIGGTNAHTPVTGLGIDFISNALRLKNIDMKTIGQDIMIQCEPDYNNEV